MSFMLDHQVHLLTRLSWTQIKFHSPNIRSQLHVISLLVGHVKIYSTFRCLPFCRLTVLKVLFRLKRKKWPHCITSVKKKDKERALLNLPLCFGFTAVKPRLSTLLTSDRIASGKLINVSFIWQLGKIHFYIYASVAKHNFWSFECQSRSTLKVNLGTSLTNTLTSGVKWNAPFAKVAPGSMFCHLSAGT